MTQKSLPWEGTGGDGGPYTSDVWDTADEIFHGREAATRGVIEEYPGGGVLPFAASLPSGGIVRVGPGAMWVKGKKYWSDANEDIAVPTPVGATRIDRITVRAIWGATKTARLYRLAGTEGSGVPESPVQNDGNTWDELCLKVTITTAGVITVEREWKYRFFGRFEGETMLWYGELGGSDGHRPVMDGLAREYFHWANGETVNGIVLGDTRDVFPIGAGTSHAKGTSGGSETKDMQHRHNYGSLATGDALEQAPSGLTFASGEYGHHHNVNSGYTGYAGGAAQDIMPPYRAWYYITYVG